MASGPHTFVTLVVFTAEKFQGNPLALVSVRGNALSQTRKSLIAKEFGYSETVFLHDAPGPGLPRRLDIFTGEGEEIPFAGHPVIGTTHYIFSQLERVKYTGPADRDAPPQSAVLLTKAGRIPIFYNNYRQLAACTVPHHVHVHSKQVATEKVLAVQPQLQIVPTIEKIKGQTFPVVSIVKGMTFALVDLTEAPELLKSLSVGHAPEVELDEEWKPSFIGALYYTRTAGKEKVGEQPIHNIHARMITQGIEDPGTGSACCALACFLALGEDAKASGVTRLEKQTANLKLEDKVEHLVYAIEQGVEMGRRCQIAVEVDVKRDAAGKREVSNVILSGRANIWAAGHLLGD